MEWLKKLNQKLYSEYVNIANNISLNLTSSEVSIQIYTEHLLKIINERENIVNNYKLGLGNLLASEKFIQCLKSKFKLSNDIIMSFNRINNLANDHKHNDRNIFDEKEVRRMFGTVLSVSVDVYNKYCDDNKLNIDVKQVFNDLLNTKLNCESILRKELENEYSNKIQKSMKEYEELKMSLEIQIKSKINAEKQFEENSNYIKEIEKLKTLISEKDFQINQMTKQTANTKDINSIKEENQRLREQLLELEKKEIPNITITNDKINKYESVINDLKNKLEEYENYLDKAKDEESKNLFELKVKRERKQVIYSSYIKEDVPFFLRNVNRVTSSKSNYKQFYAVIFNMLQRGSFIYKSDYLKLLTEEECVEVYRLEMLILSLIRTNKLGDKVWNLNYINGNKNLLEIAVNDLFEYLNNLTSVAGILYEKPKIEITCKKFIEDNLIINIEYSTMSITETRNIYFIEDLNLDATLITSDLNDIDKNFWFEKSIEYKVSNDSVKNLEWFLKLIFGHNHFRDGQFKILKNVLKGQSTIGILPTGSGKSIVYQLGALLQPKMTIIIVPTTALIKDQVNVLKTRHHISVICAIYSENSEEYSKEKELQKFENINCLFAFVSPERFQNSRFRAKLMELSDRNVFDTIVFDEVHCISEWGHQFRVAYLMVVPTIMQYCKKVKYIGLTATASTKVIKDLKSELGIKNNHSIIFNESNKRENLTFKFLKFQNIDEMNKYLIKDIATENIEPNGGETNSVLIFGKTYPKVNKIYDMLSQDNVFGDKVSRFIKGNVSSTEDFFENVSSIFVSTNVVGMGVDKPNIKKTFHYGLPSTLESFYQEAGRAGRKSEIEAKCTVLNYDYNDHEKKVIEEFFDPNTNIQRLHQIIKQNYMWDISGDLFRYKDISTNFYFLTEEIEDPLIDSKKLVEFYINIIKNNNKYLYYFTTYTKEEKRKLDKKLYFLHKCGVVKTWEVDYLNLNNARFIITLNENYKDIEFIKNSCISYITGYKDDNRQFIDNIKKVNKIEDVDIIFLETKKWYYENFIRTRITQLRNMYYYAYDKFCNRECSNEIQETVDKFFNISEFLNIKENGVFSLDGKDIVEIVDEVLNVHDFDSEIIKVSSLMEETENYKYKLYLSLLCLKNDEFNTLNGSNMFISSLSKLLDEEIKTIYEYLGKKLYPTLTDDQKYEIINLLNSLNKTIFEEKFLINIDLDEHSKLYCIYRINNLLRKIKGGL